MACMKLQLLLLLSLTRSPLAASAQTAVGVWEDYAVLNSQFKVIARPNFIFRRFHR